MKTANRFKTGIVAGLAALALAGCTGNNVSFNSLEVYLSPVIRQEYQMKVVSRRGHVDETNFAYTDEKGNLNVVGFSDAYANEESAIEDAIKDARLRAVEEIYGLRKSEKGNAKTKVSVGTLIKFFCGNREIIQVQDRDGKKGYVAEIDCQTPLDGYKNKIGLK